MTIHQGRGWHKIDSVSSRQDDKTTARWLWLIPLLLVAAWLGARGLNADMIWYDEYRSLYYAGVKNYGPISPVETAQRILDQSSGQMPLYFFLLGGWSALVGPHQYAIRVMSLLFGLLAVAWTYRLGRDMGGGRVGLVAAACMAGSAFLVLYLHELRPYTLMVMLTAMSLALYWRIAQHGRPYEFGLLLSLVALLYTQPFALPVVVALGGYHLLLGRRGRRWWRVLGVLIASGLLVAPWGLATLRVVAGEADEGGRSTALNAGEILTHIAYAFSNGTFIVALVPLLSLGQWRKSGAARLLWFLVAAVLGIVLVANHFVPIIAHIRYTITIWPLLAVAAGFALVRFRLRPSLLVGLLLVWLGTTLIASAGTTFADTLFGPVPLRWFRPHTPFHTLTSDLLPRVAAGDAIAFVTKPDGWGIKGSLNYYLHGTPARYVVVSDLGSLVEQDEYVRRMKDFVADAGRVWLVTEIADPAMLELADFQAVLAGRQLQLCGRVGEWPGLSLDLYARADVLCDLDADGDALVQFDEGIRLLDFDLLEAPTAQGLRLVSTWSVPLSVPADIYSVALHVTDPDGNLVAQTDFGLPDGPFGYAFSQIEWGVLPPQDYTLSVIVYEWATGARLNATHAQTGDQSERQVLATFAIPGS